MHYDETDYGSIAKCKFCDTEYHIDKLGRVEEYKVKLKIHNRIIEFYLVQQTISPEYEEVTYLDGYRSFRRQYQTRIVLEMEGWL